METVLKTSAEWPEKRQRKQASLCKNAYIAGREESQDKTGVGDWGFGVRAKYICRF